MTRGRRILAISMTRAITKTGSTWDIIWLTARQEAEEAQRALAIRIEGRAYQALGTLQGHTAHQLMGSTVCTKSDHANMLIKCTHTRRRCARKTMIGMKAVLVQAIVTAMKRALQGATISLTSRTRIAITRSSTITIRRSIMVNTTTIITTKINTGTLTEAAQKTTTAMSRWLESTVATMVGHHTRGTALWADSNQTMAATSIVRSKGRPLPPKASCTHSHLAKVVASQTTHTLKTSTCTVMRTITRTMNIVEAVTKCTKFSKSHKIDDSTRAETTKCGRMRSLRRVLT